MTRSKKKNVLPESRLTRFIAAVLRPFYGRKVSGTENISPSEPAVFVCNHGRISGPVTAVLHLPVRVRPWINACMLDRGEATSTMMNTFRDKMTFLGPGLKRKLLYGLSGPICHVLNSFGPVPVHKGDPRKSLETIILGVEALERGENLLIFPEKPGDRYDEESYKEFNSGFAALGRAYCKRTGRNLKFYPVFSDSASRKFIIGKSVSYDPDNGSREEKMRITAELKDRMMALKSLCNEQ
ncbi:MAG: 1-acyl-sn-glycerol-3-phosphate acyltransferase [Bacteroidales bacterium]|nr:1-acyl-sn-glycerol-3-phosphate acyltransferase [Bacteroidales bacterium]